MPTSEDEYEQYRTRQEPQSTMSKAELRKTHKPIMEKRRRARINHCLNEIKNLILEAMNKDPTRHSKLEKADILEMAVKHLQNVQRQQLAIAMASDPSVLRKFKTGFNDCAGEIDKYMRRIEGADGALKQNINAHLQKCITGIEQIAHFNFPEFSSLPFLTSTGIHFNQRKLINDSPGDQNNNPRLQTPQGPNMLPSRLPSVPTEELSLHIADNNNQQHSAFMSVTASSFQIPERSIGNSNPFAEKNTGPSSPQGFRPVQTNKNSRTCVSPVHQVSQISSTSLIQEYDTHKSSEVKFVKYPINNHLDHRHSRKITEPLCIITNQAERYKQAQKKIDSAHFEENLPSEMTKKQHENQGLLVIVSQEESVPTQKIFKPNPVTTASIQCSSTSSSSFPTRIPEEASNSNRESGVLSYSYSLENTRRNESPENEMEVRQNVQNNENRRNNENTCDMWRPW